MLLVIVLCPIVPIVPSCGSSTQTIPDQHPARPTLATAGDPNPPLVAQAQLVVAYTEGMEQRTCFSLGLQGKNFQDFHLTYPQHMIYPHDHSNDSSSHLLPMWGVLVSEEAGAPGAVPSVQESILESTLGAKEGASPRWTSNL